MSKFDRGAGILLHITSLPGKYGIGDFGDQAYTFVDFLERSGQKYWQILPLTPIEQGQYYSPYSSPSAFAGNWLLINPDKLVKLQLLSSNLTKSVSGSGLSQVNYENSIALKRDLFSQAFTNFTQLQHDHALKEEYKAFEAQQSYWLNAFTLFISIKDMFQGKSWNEWPKELRSKDKYTLGKYSLKLEMEIYFQKFLQFLFHKQWFELKQYANSKGIKIIGDLPIYVNYDSVDVWWHPELFKLDENLEMTVVAGVPPDYFSETGQLWGMPIYNWKRLEQTKFSWWHQRFGRNTELYDIIRLDHFRAFSSYWEVPAGEKTAIPGTWQQGPAYHLFNSLKSGFKQLPVIAEDLGEIDNAVHELRDHYYFPGMKVLQFGFGDDMPESIHITHNYSKNVVAYSGTHDNNTLVGWYKKDIDHETRKKVRRYLNSGVSAFSIHKKFIHLLYQSVASIVIIPAQDLLGLDQNATMNIPSTVGNNWKWRLKKGAMKRKHQKFLKNLTLLFNR